MYVLPHIVEKNASNLPQMIDDVDDFMQCAVFRGNDGAAPKYVAFLGLLTSVCFHNYQTKFF